MYKNEVIIGRQVAKGEFLVEDKYKSVSRSHAKIIRKKDGLYIEDLDSANGTYVNGIRVRSKKVGLSDVISLGGAKYYIVNLNNVVKLLSMSDEEFSCRIMELKQVYDDYQTESSRLQSKGQEDMMTKRMLPTLLSGGIVSALGAILGSNEETKIMIVIGGILLSVVVFIMATKWATSSNQKMKEKLIQLNEGFELDYVCPSCGASFRGRSWEFIKRQGKCPVCQRVFRVKQ
jgi:pSer/pThr/pTyr-binding forkhead associated (FHA) protein